MNNPYGESWFDFVDNLPTIIVIDHTDLSMQSPPSIIHVCSTTSPSCRRPIPYALSTSSAPPTTTPRAATPSSPPPKTTPSSSGPSTHPASVRTFKEHAYCVYSAVWNPHHVDVFASASGDCTVCVWDVREPGSTMIIPAHEFEILENQKVIMKAI
ncbi:hypothetical protein ACLB2K_057331 [Fragaria x ananassa]